MKALDHSIQLAQGLGRYPHYYRRTTCRACGGVSLRPFLSLGPTPPANSFLRSLDEADTELFYPLDVYFCESCSLVQLLDVIDPEVLFRNYIYVTGTSETILAHSAQYARTVVETLELTPRDLVVEIASNDGTLLKCFGYYGVKTLGVEPAENIAEMARADGIETLSRFFDSSVAREIRALYGPAKAVIANNVLAHVDEPRDFLDGCRELLHEDGLVIVEVPYLRDLLERLEYDTIYHEHLCYFSVNTLVRLFESVGLSIVRLDRVPVHGGSLRVYAARTQWPVTRLNTVSALAEAERREGLTGIRRYEEFSQKVEENRQALSALLVQLRSEEKTIVGYGASAKGNTLLNYCCIGPDLIPYIVDKNPLKVGLYTPGMHIPVMPVAALTEDLPEYLFILAWNFADEIIRQQGAFREQGGRVIIPIPEPVVK